jgi:hypothetical protein
MPAAHRPSQSARAGGSDRRRCSSRKAQLDTGVLRMDSDGATLAERGGAGLLPGGSDSARDGSNAPSRPRESTTPARPRPSIQSWRVADKPAARSALSVRVANHLRDPHLSALRIAKPLPVTSGSAETSSPRTRRDDSSRPRLSAGWPSERGEDQQGTSLVRPVAPNMPSLPFGLSTVMARSMPPPGCTPTPLFRPNPGQDWFMLQAPSHPLGVVGGFAAVLPARAVSESAASTNMRASASFIGGTSLVASRFPKCGAGLPLRGNSVKQARAAALAGPTPLPAPALSVAVRLSSRSVARTGSMMRSGFSKPG